MPAFPNALLFFSSAKSVRPASSKKRRFRRQLPGPLVGGGQFARLVLARLDVRLIERIDAEDRARNGRGELPAEEFLADVIAIGDGDAHDRMTGAFERGDRVILLRIRFARQPHIDEQAICRRRHRAAPAARRRPE